MRIPVFGLFISILLSCQSNRESTDKFIFRYNESAALNSLDPAFAREKSNLWVTNQLYNGLVQMDNNLQVKPSIAKRFVLDSTATHYTFTLRSDVFFHANACFGADSTRVVTAHDFAYSFTRLLSPELASPGRWTFDAVDTFWAENDTTLNIKLRYPFAPFTGILTMKYCSVVPHEAILAYGETFSQNPVGTGPFTFVAWHRNEKLVLRKNPRYFEQDENGTPLPYADGVAIRFVTDPQAAFLEFLKGNNHLISGLDASYKDELLSPEGELNPKYAERFILAKQPYLNTEYLIFTVDSANPELVIDKRLRLAINLGFSRKNMMAYLRNNIGKPADGGMVPFGLPGYGAGTGYTYNPDKARALLADYKKEFGQLPTITLSTVSNYRDVCEFIQGELGKLGLIIQVDVVPPANLREQKSQGTMPFFRASWIADYPDAENYFMLFYGPNRSPNGSNYARYHNPQFDRWYLQAQQSSDEAQRQKIYHQMDSLLIYDAPIVPLFYDEMVRIYPRNFTGLESNALNVLDLRRVREF
jgi:peptide/nickel transport system substrate-binding protein